MKRKLISLFSVLTLLCALIALHVSAAEQTVTVTVANGMLAAHREISLTDCDGDGALTINDALIGIHDAAYEGGATAGYTSYQGDWGLAISKLWGVENGGAYGYFVNNASAMNLADPIKDGDAVYAFAYTDLSAWSDTFCYFNTTAETAAVGKKITLTLSSIAYDENFAPITVPVVGATLTIDGETTGLVTDENGKVSFTPVMDGTFTLSAVSTVQTLTPPVCVLKVAAAPQTGDDIMTYIIIAVLAAAVLLVILFLLPRRKRK